ncbi:MAG: LCP family protein [Bacillota bacterium]
MSRRRKIIKALYITIAVLVLAACGLGAVAFIRAKAAWDNPGGTLVAGGDKYGYKDSIVNLVLLGTDTSTEREAEHAGVRTDTIVICAIDMEKNTARCITVPRDTYAKVNTVNSKGEITGEEDNRINAAYSRGVHGNKGYNYQNTLDALGDLLGSQIPLRYYAAVDMDGIAPIADAVGGVYVTLDATITDVGQKGQTVLLTGKTAEAYVRARKGGALNGSDLARAQRQQAFFLGLAKRIKELGPMDAVPRLWGSLQQYFETNMSLEDMLAFASILNKMNTKNITFRILEGTTRTLHGMSLFFPDDKKLQELVRETWFNL